MSIDTVHLNELTLIAFTSTSTECNWLIFFCVFFFEYFRCDGVNTWGSYSLTLIDSLDTLAVMGNFTEFRRVVDILIEKSNFDSDINVSVFETNIRIVGGLLGAHLMQHRSGATLEPGWPCNGPLLRMAEDVVCSLIPSG